MLMNALELLLPKPLLQHDGPSTVQAYINEQKHKNRWTVHLLHYIPQRKAEFLEIIEDTIPIYNLKLSLNLPKQPKEITCVPNGRKLDFEMRDGRVEFVVPQVNGHEMVVVEFFTSLAVIN